MGGQWEPNLKRRGASRLHMEAVAVVDQHIGLGCECVPRHGVGESMRGKKREFTPVAVLPLGQYRCHEGKGARYSPV